jgi:signal transduction histidine kinase
LFAGLTQYLKAAGRIVRKQSMSEDQGAEIKTEMDQIRSKVLLVESFDRFKTAGTGPTGSAFLSGVVRDGKSGLIYTDPDGWGIALNLDAIVEALEERLPPVYAIRLFDLESLPEIARKTSEFVRVVSPASKHLHRLNLALFPKDRLGLFRELRQKRVLAVAGVLALAALIGGGVWLIYRGTTRELELARLRSEFVSNVSHELRTPLQSIQMYAETLSLKRYRDEAQHQRYLDTITQESNRLARMVGNVLDFSRIEQGRKSYQFRSVELGPLVSKTLSDFESGMMDRGFTLRKVLAEDIVVNADADAIDSVIGNLLANAIRYSTDRLEVEVRVAREDGNAVVEVLDRGIGVPADERADIFEKFYRASNVVDATGTGLGLCLVRDIVKAHGGSCEVQEREGGGSVFRIRLPEVVSS